MVDFFYLEPKERTAGDGMESDITINLPTVNGTSSPARGNINIYYTILYNVPKT